MDQRAFAGFHHHLALHLLGVMAAHFKVVIGTADLVAAVGHFQAIVAANVGKPVTANIQGLVLSDGGLLVAADVNLFVPGYVQALVVADVRFAIVANGVLLVVVDLQLMVFLGPEINQLLVFFVFKTQFVVATTLVGLRPEYSSGSVCGQGIGWRGMSARL